MSAGTFIWSPQKTHMAKFEQTSDQVLCHKNRTFWDVLSHLQRVRLGLRLKISEKLPKRIGIFFQSLQKTLHSQILTNQDSWECALTMS